MGAAPVEFDASLDAVNEVLEQALATERALGEFRTWLENHGMQFKPALAEFDRLFPSGGRE